MSCKSYSIGMLKALTSTTTPTWTPWRGDQVCRLSINKTYNFKRNQSVKTVKTKKRRSLVKNCSKVTFVWLLWALISQTWNGLLRHFQCPKSSAGNPVAVEKGPGSIAPLWGELWPFKEGNRQFYPKIEAKVPLFGNPFSNAHISGLGIG